jgi:hypothetical protein
VRAAMAIRTLTATFAEHRDDAPTYLQALIEAPRIGSLHEGVVELWAELRALLGSHIARMREQGELDTWVDPNAMAGVLVAIANGLVLQVTVDPDGPALDAMASQFGALLLAARRAP